MSHSVNSIKQRLQPPYSNVLMERKKQRDANAKHDPPPQKKRDPLPVVAKIRHGVNSAGRPLGDKIAHTSVPERVGLVKEYERYWRVSAVSFTSVQANEWSISRCTETLLCIARSQNLPMKRHPKVLVNAYDSLKLAPTEISCVGCSLGIETSFFDLSTSEELFY